MVSVVVPAFNEEELIANCLNSLAKQKTAREFEVILVDNNSTDKTVAIARTFQKKLSLKIIKEKKKGRGIARHTGFAAAAGKYILSTDADIRVPQDWVEKLGGFDTSANEMEDVDLSFKISRLGKIKYLSVPVTFSGRRFKKNFIGGLFSYITVYSSYFFFNKRNAVLEDVR